MTMYPFDLQTMFGPDDLPGQYVLAQEAAVLPAGWPRQTVGRWHLACHPRLPAHRLVDGTGAAVGFVLGFPITAEMELVVGNDCELVLPDAARPEGWLDGLSGSWIALLLAGARQRVYLDPAGSITAVYCAAERMVARSSFLIPYGAGTPDRREFIELMPIPGRNAYYPPGMTPRVGVDRLLPNHVLDLESWEVSRQWPLAWPELVDETTAAVAEIAAHVKATYTAVARHFPLQFSMTAGRDSRALAACARPFLERSAFVTTELPSETAYRDVYYARRIAREQGMPHKVIPYVAPDERERMLWLYRTGMAAGNYYSYLGMRAAKEFNPQAAYMQARLSGIGRDAYSYELLALEPTWSRDSFPAELLVQKMYAPATEEALARSQVWLDSLPSNEGWRVLNQMEIDLVVGSRTAVLANAFVDTHALEIWPYNNRRVVELLSGFHGRYKLEARYHSEVVALEWPALGNYPVNEDDRRLAWGRKLRKGREKLWGGVRRSTAAG